MPRRAVKPEGGQGLPENAVAKAESITDLKWIMAEGVNPDGSLKPAVIRALCVKAGLIYNELAREMGCTGPYIHAVIDRRKRSIRIENAIALRLRLEPARIWGRSPQPVGRHE